MTYSILRHMKPAALALSASLTALTGCTNDNALETAAKAQGDSRQNEKVIATRTAELLSRMTLEEKIGQVIQADIASITPEEVGKYNLGSILNGGNSAPGGGKVAAPQAWVDLADAFWLASTDTSDGGVGIPALWGTDAVHGHNNLQNATIFPHNSGLGAAGNPDLMRQIGDVTAREIRATGLDWTFAPTLAVAQDDRWGRAYESYSENPDVVAAYATPLIEGLQGLPSTEDFLVGDNVIATAKHFVGDGGTQMGIDKGDTIGNLEDILNTHGAGYGPAIASDVQTVMASFSSINGEKMHGSKQLLTEILRDDMGFTGLVVGDWNGHAEIPGCTATDCPEALMAGIDLYMAPDSWRGLYDSLLTQAQSGKLPMERLDEAVARILAVKLRSGLFEAGLPSARASSDLSLLGHPDHRAIARDAVRQSLVLLKNENAILPLQAGQSVLVAGSGADSMQQQTGGWTLDWQGSDNSNEEFETGESIYAGLRKALDDIGAKATLSLDGTYDEAPDVVVIVFGEQPYAEYRGDVSDLVFEFEGEENIALIRSLKAEGIPVVSVFLTGRPLFTSPHINASDAFVVAWLPGTEAGGVADVLVADVEGEPRYDFTGRLSFSWPADGTGTLINAPDDPGLLFPFGYGLSYGDEGDLGILSEDPKVESATDFDGTIMARGDVTSSFELYLGDSSNLNVPVSGLMGESLGGAISVRGIDYRAQEDARRFAWSGNGMGLAKITASRSLDLTADKDSALRVFWRIETRPSKPMTIGFGCGEGCAIDFDLASALNVQNTSDWVETILPLRCLPEDGFDASAVEDVLKLQTNGEAVVSLHNVSIITADSASIACPKPSKL